MSPAKRRVIIKVNGKATVIFPYQAPLNGVVNFSPAKYFYGIFLKTRFSGFCRHCFNHHLSHPINRWSKITIIINNSNSNKFSIFLFPREFLLLSLNIIQSERWYSANCLNSENLLSVSALTFYTFTWTLRLLELFFLLKSFLNTSAKSQSPYKVEGYGISFDLRGETKCILWGYVW